jgi:hypothetical protein
VAQQVVSTTVHPEARPLADSITARRVAVRAMAVTRAVHRRVAHLLAADAGARATVHPRRVRGVALVAQVQRRSRVRGVASVKPSRIVRRRGSPLYGFERRERTAQLRFRRQIHINHNRVARPLQRIELTLQ